MSRGKGHYIVAKIISYNVEKYLTLHLRVVLNCQVDGWIRTRTTQKGSCSNSCWFQIRKSWLLKEERFAEALEVNVESVKCCSCKQLNKEKGIFFGKKVFYSKSWILEMVMADFCLKCLNTNVYTGLKIKSTWGTWDCYQWLQSIQTYQDLTNCTFWGALCGSMWSFSFHPFRM